MINQLNYAEAKGLYSAILKLDADNIDALNSLAQCIRAIANQQQNPNRQQVFSQALQLYQRALSIDSEDFETNFNLGVLYYEFKKDYEKAIYHLKLAINEEDNPTALFNLAVIFEEKGESQDAMKMYKKVSQFLTKQANLNSVTVSALNLKF